MRILFVQTGFLGDVILSTSVLSNLKKLYPGAEIWAMTTPLADSLVAHHPAVTGTIPFDKRGSRRGLSGFLAMRKELQSRRFDIVFSLHKSLRTALLLLSSGIPRRYGFRESAGWFLYSKTARRSDLAHDALRNLAILRTIGYNPEQLDTSLHIGVPEEVRLRALSLIASSGGRPIIGIAPGSVWATKRWTVDGFASVARYFANKGAAVVLIGGPEDGPIAGAILSAVPETSVTNLVGATTVLESAAVISQLSLLISNDSAPLHMASAALIPVVGVFCATIPEFGFGPWQTISETVGVDGLACRPCGRHGGQQCPTGTHACQLQLTPEAVIQAAERVLARVTKNATTARLQS